MSKFAKLFHVEREGKTEQVVVMTDRDEETKPCLRIITDIDGMTVAVTSNFHDTDEGWDGRDAAFEKYDTPQAVDFLDQINKLIADGLKVGLEISEKVPAE